MTAVTSKRWNVLKAVTAKIQDGSRCSQIPVCTTKLDDTHFSLPHGEEQLARNVGGEAQVPDMDVQVGLRERNVEGF